MFIYLIKAALVFLGWTLVCSFYILTGIVIIAGLEIGAKDNFNVFSVLIWPVLVVGYGISGVIKLVKSVGKGKEV